VLESLRTRWTRNLRGPMPANNERQALVPEGATVWPNPVGSAPGILVEHEGKHVALLPGVPEEMRTLAQQFLAPLARTLSGRTIEYAVVRTVGIAESVLEERLKDLSHQRSSQRYSVVRLAARLAASQLSLTWPLS